MSAQIESGVAELEADEMSQDLLVQCANPPEEYLLRDLLGLNYNTADMYQDCSQYDWDA